MRIQRSIRRATVTALALAALSFDAFAAPVEVDYTVSGTPGDWSLDFKVHNNLTGDFEPIYFFGVLLDAPGITGSPAGFDPKMWPIWNNEYRGGSPIDYNNNWIDLAAVSDFLASNLLVGSALDGFIVHVDDATAPTSVRWFAWAVGGVVPDVGGGQFNPGDAYNPGFEGTAFVATVPEPAGNAMLLAGIGLLGAYGACRRVRSRVST
jgi:hypothetical protein